MVHTADDTRAGARPLTRSWRESKIVLTNFRIARLSHMAPKPRPRWWSARRAQNLKPATYRCPLCGQHLPALSEHMLIAPEGDSSRRRHAHTRCVIAARRAGRLATREEWQATQPRQPGLLRRALGRLSRERGGTGGAGDPPGGDGG
jgi:hypothetical protein